MGKYGYVSPENNSGRLVAHEKITSLPFRFKSMPFSIKVIPKSVTSDINVLVNVKLYQDDTASGLPVILNYWDEALFREILPTEGLLENFDIYWGTGEYVKPEERIL